MRAISRKLERSEMSIEGEVLELYRRGISDDGIRDKLAGRCGVPALRSLMSRARYKLGMPPRRIAQLGRRNVRRQLVVALPEDLRDIIEMLASDRRTDPKTLVVRVVSAVMMGDLVDAVLDDEPAARARA